MLSGIGRRGNQGARIAVEVDLPGVGRTFRIATRLPFPTDAQARQVLAAPASNATIRCGAVEAPRAGYYASSGAVLAWFAVRAVAARSDIFCMALPSRFEGYFRFLVAHPPTHRLPDLGLLKAHTRNRAARSSCGPPTARYAARELQLFRRDDDAE